MAIRTFASIYIGSYEVNLKIFEITPKKTLRPIDFVRSRVNLGRDIFRNKSIGYEMVDELCLILSEFGQIMESYRVEDYRVYAFPAMQDLTNELFVLNQIYLRTGYQVSVISNSHHRLLSYKAVAGQPAFEKAIQTSAAVVDLGGSSVQITLFRSGELVNTQRIEAGTMRMGSILNRPGITKAQYLREIEDFINKHLDTYRAMYLDGKVANVIILSDYGMAIAGGMQQSMGKNTSSGNAFHADAFLRYVEHFDDASLMDITMELNLSDDQDPIIIPTLQLAKALIHHLEPTDIWFPGTDISDGIAYDYAHENHLVNIGHDFDKDIISASQHLADHYHSYSDHIKALSKVSSQLFDTMKKIHGMDKRYRILLQVAALLHDVGKYVSFSDAPQCACQIIRSSEIIGLSHEERETVALAVLYNSRPVDPYAEVSDLVSQENYLNAVKMASILRIANALDQSHKQKFGQMKLAVKDHQLVITVETYENITLEQILFEEKTELFEQVFSMKPLLKEKRVTGPSKRKVRETK